ncbi:MAG: hypothetical protein M1816_002630 [Peltula sp. TS41687]|nr:MAG: hypothetical protein M1816_002630 [Peltula sp. TS41687]
MSASRGPVASSVTVAAPMAPSATRFSPGIVLRPSGSRPMPPPLPTFPPTAAPPHVQLSPPPPPPLGSRVDRFNRHRRGEAGDRSQLSLYERSTLRFQELLLARLDSIESTYRAAHGQPPVIPEDDESDDDGGDDEDVDGDEDRAVAAAGADSS